ncbi:MAG: hypothetical protein U5J83_19260 [Bryobacterales bacterium]|nr:hypothetical protein [Bryobacterales bacterium]
MLEEIIARSGPTRCSPRSAGRPALNLSVALAEAGVLDKYGVELIGAKIEAIKKAEDRLLFKDAMAKIGLEVPHSAPDHQASRKALISSTRSGYPVILRPASRWAARAAASRTTARSCRRSLERGLDPIAGPRDR